MAGREFFQVIQFVHVSMVYVYVHNVSSVHETRKYTQLVGCGVLHIPNTHVHLVMSFFLLSLAVGESNQSSMQLFTSMMALNR